MCDPVSILAVGTLAIGTGSAIAQHSAQNQASKANKNAALADLAIQRNDLSTRGAEEKMAASQDINQAVISTHQAEGITRAGAADAGVAGMSIDALLGTMEGENASYRQSVNDNLVVSLDQLERQKAGAAATAQGRINSVSGGNPFLTGLRIAGAALDAYTIKLGSKPKGT